MRREARRRWLAVVTVLALLCALPVLIGFAARPKLHVDPAQLRERILASSDQPYQGYVSTDGEIQMPDVPAIRDIAGLFGATLRLRAWYAGPRQWRVALLQTTGELDIYGTPAGTYVWDFERNLMAVTVGDADLALRPPTAADLVPPELARRLLAFEAQVDEIESRRVGGVAAAGLRVIPSDPMTTIGRVDVWADPATGIAVQVEITARGSTEPVFTSRFLEVEMAAPAPDVVAPRPPASAGFTVVTAESVASTLNAIAPVPLPPRLAGRERLGGSSAIVVVGLAAYGPGLSTFAVIALPGRVGFDALNAARERGGQPVSLPNAGAAYETSTTLVNGLIVRSVGDRRSRRTYLLAGPVSADVLRQAAGELLVGGAAQ